MQTALFGSDLWKPALDKYAEATGLTVELYGLDGQVVLASTYLTPLTGLLREYGFEPGLFRECARRCVKQTYRRPVVVADESHGLIVVGTSLALEGAVVGAAVAGYALTRFSQVATAQRWSRSARMPFDRVWNILRALSPVPERRLLLNGELLQVLGDALLRENYRTRQFEDAAAKLQQLSAAKDEFLAVLSHELRTPLAPILGWAGILRKDDSPERVRQAVEAIERNARLQGRMIEDLLDLNLIEHRTVKLDPRLLELDAVVRAALETSGQHIEGKGIDAQILGAGEPLLVEGDAVRLQQIFGNVLSNAVKFTPAAGKIRITLGREGDTAQVVVADTGMGIAPEFLPFVFDIFRQQEHGTRRTHEGLGIGLALVKRLAELHRGTVSVASAGSGRGTEVTIRLPISTRDNHAPKPTGPARLEGALADLRVLLVEDFADARESLHMLLEHLGAQVLAADDGAEGLELIRKEQPDVVLCDLRMPGMDGFDLMRELRRHCPTHPPVVAMSALASEADHARTREAGFEGHLDKPFTEADVVAALGTALRRWWERQLSTAPVKPDPSGLRALQTH